MKRADILEVKASILADLNADARRLRAELKRDGIFYLNVMSSPGSGKTSFILKTLNTLKNRYNMAVMEADIDSDVDMQTIRDAGFPSIQLHTGGMCHLDADMSRQGMAGLRALLAGKNVPGDYENAGCDGSGCDGSGCDGSGSTSSESAMPNVFILENVGNLVCPAEFDTGAVKNVVILSVPEGDDKPLKYPLIFKVCDVVIVNKMDTLPVFDFDLVRFEGHVKALNPDALIFPVCSLTGEGVGAFADWLADQIDAWRE